MKKIEAKSNDRELDQFYTSEKVVDYVIKKSITILKNRGYDLSKENHFVEPSAGSGAFIEGLKRFNFNKIEGFDIDPKSEGIKKADFLSLEKTYKENVVTIGNPPFGYKASLAIKFINKALEFSDVVIFILPIQFKRFLTHKQIKDDAKLIYESPQLPKNSFVYKGKPYDVNCIFQIWANKNVPGKDLRIKKAPASSHKDFTLYTYNNTIENIKFFDKSKYLWDFAVHRQGYYDYNIKITNPNELKKNRQYLFIKINKPEASMILDKIDFQKLSHSNTSVKGFSNTNLIREYNRLKRKKTA